MQAITFYNYGSPEVLKLENIDKPTIREDEVLVKVHAASANPLDWHIMRAEPILARFDSGLFKPKNNQLGADVAGVVEAVGSNVTDFKVGDAVFGDAFGHSLGSFAEYAAVPAGKLVLKPDNISFEEAAAVPVAAITALQGWRHAGLEAPRPGIQVLVNGASGGVGTYAVQIAKAFGAEVTGVCSTRNLELVQSIGADHVIDYTKDDFTKQSQKYDLVFDSIGNRSVGDLLNALKPGGFCTVIGFTTMPRLFQHMLYAPLRSRFSEGNVAMMGTAQTNQKDLLILQEMLADGQIKSVIDCRYPLAETAEAIGYLEKGHARGKVVITVAE